MNFYKYLSFLFLKTFIMYVFLCLCSLTKRIYLFRRVIYLLRIRKKKEEEEERVIIMIYFKKKS